MTSTAIRKTPRRVAIVQSNYIPWKGYFDLINSVDEFILYDDVQYTRRDWRNRNRIKTRHGIQWLSIPVEVKGKYDQAIKDTKIASHNWNHHHWRTIVHGYSRAPCFNESRKFFEDLYHRATSEWLTEINFHFISAICRWLRIPTKISFSMDYELIAGKTERLLHLCQQAGATEYVSGPAARGYLDEDSFERSGIQVQYFDYDGYSAYRQLFPPFEHSVSVVDLILNEGTQAPCHMKSFSRAERSRRTA
jgi:hypothetical protein